MGDFLKKAVSLEKCPTPLRKQASFVFMHIHRKGAGAVQLATGGADIPARGQKNGENAKKRCTDFQRKP